MKLSDVQIQADNTREMTKERKKAIKKYLELCVDFEKLRSIGVCSHIVVNKIQMEEQIEDQPKIEQEYLQFLLLPFASFEWGHGKERCLDNFDTDVIELFNERIEKKVEAYKDFVEFKIK